MKIVDDDFKIKRIESPEFTAPVYIIGLPDDIKRLKI